ncbi:protein Skeletor, isoforms B/C [Lingula anatina]|uniref:Protein Skeletor, isoforms B/C n=2 Tax=Lingula anatina TaxID=7574 RepID=A0A1S3HI58_LINAN|nr:protein Skeletor, isoforms B/C [Lingula anatina]|eukprot:XP_013385793.1 protein Skeletor, isoforms B/C [Lingula anatina]
MLLLACIAAVIFCCSNAAEYHGKLIGPIQELYHGVKGTVYAVDSHRFKILGFTYDGQGPDAFFYIGLRQNATRDTPSDEGIKILDEKGSSAVLKEYKNVTLTLTLPEGIRIQDIKWLSVWCVAFSADFGHIIIPIDIDPPRPQVLGPFKLTTHGVSSGNIIVLDTKTVVIPNFKYDGLGPDGFFWVGSGPLPTSEGTKVPDENGSLKKLGEYTGQNLTLRLPKDLTFHTVEWLGVWCVLFGVNFGYVSIPLELNVPPFTPKVTAAATPQTASLVKNCEPLASNFHVSWETNSSHVMIELKGQIANGDYMSFGPSGSDTSTKMIGADVVITWYDEQSGPMAVDYYITQYSQCSNGVGVCPDTSRPNEKNDVQVVSGERANGITTIKYTRPLASSDTGDNIFVTDKNTYLAWAIGPLSADKLPLKHSVRTPGDLMINFGRPPVNNCPEFQTLRPTIKPKKPWVPQTLSGENTRIFTARLGPTGGKRGYEGITGRPSWGIAWYINDILIPELILKRGVSYIFLINGGHTESNQANYHPFYITDDPEGGYIQYTTPEQRQKVKIFPGRNVMGATVNYQVGRLCEWEQETGAPQDAESFAEYSKYLKLKCYEGRPGVFVWSPDRNTPDTVYYQCYTHKYLGWKIHIVDEFPGKETKVATKAPPLPAEPSTTPVAVTAPSTTPTTVTIQTPQPTTTTTVPSTQPVADTVPNSQSTSSPVPSTQPVAYTVPNSQSPTTTAPSTQPVADTVPISQATTTTAPSIQSVADTVSRSQSTTTPVPISQSTSTSAPSTQPVADTMPNSQSTTTPVPSTLPAADTVQIS